MRRPPRRSACEASITSRSSVSDVKRSVDFYQGLFGMPVISRQGMTTNLQIGAGPQFLGVSAAGSNAPNINHLCLGVDDFNVDRIAAALGQRGITKTDAAGNAGGGGLGGGPMRMRVRMRGTGSRRRPRTALRSCTSAIPTASSIQLQDPRYCGGGGALGNVCPPPEPSPKKGLLALRGWSHCTIFVFGRRAVERLLSGSLRPARSGVPGADRSGARRRRRAVPDVCRRWRPRPRECRAASPAASTTSA